MSFTMKKPSGISPILKEVSHQLGLEKEMTLQKLRQEWEGLAGTTIAAHTFPEKLKFKTLTLLVDSATWIQELTFLKPGLIQKINRVFGIDTIHNLVLKRGSVPLPKRHLDKKKYPKNTTLTKKETLLINEVSATIPDGPLKECIQKAMRRHLHANTKTRKSDEVSG